ncbi:hypothetical protein Daura_26060 [Dactylosporangium aurantiacum]|uniref:Uncharacterized protein n=1 Tax=Dactylosporangium aurantiacum TaxID=35754 RepID=A0A9Q9I6R7_9ACTN|nr:hypothetical protein [Dactylosporangium aurantiacum]MDG6109701.1 hypothetical protein [Dactylosporangium aurantiacum]UWZ50312.1 hypothetical protein Daura_26060 [Dactylosporangium aurantiacum]
MPDQRPPVPPRRPGRPVDPVLGYGPAAEVARRLRTVRAAAGDPSYQKMATRVRSNATTMSQTDRGDRLPLLVNLVNYLVACDADTATVEAWRRDHPEYERRAAAFRPDLTDVHSRCDLYGALADLLRDAGVTAAELSRRKVHAEQHGAPDALPVPVPGDAALSADPRTTPPTDHGLLWSVYLAGGTGPDVRHWAQCLERLGPPETPEPGPAPGPHAMPPEPPAVVPAPAAAPQRRGPRWRTARVAVAAGLLVLLLTGVAYAAGAVAERAGDRAAHPSPGRSGDGGVPTSSPPVNATGGAPAVAELDAIIEATARTDVPTGNWAHVDFALTVYGPAPDYRRVVNEVTEQLDWSMGAQGRRVVHGTDVAPSPETLPPGPPRGAAGPPSADPDELRRVLELRRRPGGASVLILGVADLCDSYPLTAAQRVAVLRMLRAAPDLAYQGKATVDELRAPGKAFSADGPDGTREVLVLDPATGRLLEHQSLSGGPGGSFVQTRRVVYLRSYWDDLPD